MAGGLKWRGAAGCRIKLERDSWLGDRTEEGLPATGEVGRVDDGVPELSEPAKGGGRA